MQLTSTPEDVYFFLKQRLSMMERWGEEGKDGFPWNVFILAAEAWSSIYE